MLKEIMARIAGIVVIIIIAIIVNFVLKRIPNDSNIKRFIRKWGRIITNVATTVITILTFIFPWISSPIFDEDTEEYYDEPSYSEVVTTSSTTIRLPPLQQRKLLPLLLIIPLQLNPLQKKAVILTLMLYR